MKFRTEIEIAKFEHEIKPKSKLFLCGSCFTQNIGQKFTESNFDVLYNPFGILYNPHSIANCIHRIAEQSYFSEADFFHTANRWQSYELHSDYAAKGQTETIERINRSIEKANQQLKEAEFIFLTFGSSFVFELISNQQIVANCHKQAAKLFRSRFLSQGEIQAALQKSINDLKKLNQKASIIFTVSPVRHWRDGAFGNQISKSNLFTALYKFTENRQVTYFPAYEILMDELRDYRYYADDMLHLSNLAIEYIWQQMQATYFSAEAMSFYVEIQKIKKAVQHRPINPQSEAYKQFKANTLEQIQKLAKKYDIDLSKYKLRMTND